MKTAMIMARGHAQSHLGADFHAENVGLDERPSVHALSMQAGQHRGQYDGAWMGRHHE